MAGHHKVNAVAPGHQTAPQVKKNTLRTTAPLQGSNKKGDVLWLMFISL